MNDKNRQSSNWLLVKVTPNASRNEMTGFRDGVLQIKVAAPPVGGKANKELIDFLSRVLDVRKSAISIVKGQTGRDKAIAIEGMSREEILKQLRKSPSFPPFSKGDENDR